MKVKSMLELTAKAHPRGPQDQAKPDMNRQMRRTTARERDLFRELVAVRWVARMAPMARPSSEPVDQGHGDDSAGHVERPYDERRQQGGVVLEAHRLEEDGGVEHDGVDPRELLENLHDNGDHQLRPAGALHEVAEGVLHLPSLLAGAD
ncbi:unnamed protein product [Spirodela intermedia]|uniref:Uncharacterized protein n=1 Tax=Spirodela intermedia TaxID=51605 RepID=A0A7I8KCN4_SPIIN|nr:unnamed protein product [Spirodela intermedia]